MLTTSTHDGFLQGISYYRLPANFQDAITITRRLGIQYLWIDSLCIIQDSVQDWLEESKKMGGIYEDAAFTIAAMTSGKSTDGILVASQSNSKHTHPVLLPVSRIGEINASIEALPRKKNQEYLSDLVTSSVLASRGWTLQESVLSARVLFFGNKQIYWRCQSGFQYADGRLSQLGDAWVLPDFPDLKDSYPAMRSYGFSNAMMSPGHAGVDEKEAILEEYYYLVHDYTRRRLTVASDKLPAFSGLSERAHRAVGGAYLAGLWSNDIKRSLLFHVSLSDDHKPAPPSREYRAPSWSWASLDCPVRFVNDLDGSDALDLELVNHEVILRKNDNPYGEVAGASLVVEGIIIPLFCSTQTFLARSNFPHEGWSCFDGVQKTRKNQVSDPAGRSGRRGGRWVPVIDDDIRGRHIVECGVEFGGVGAGAEEADVKIDPQAYSSVEYFGLFVATGSWGDLYFLILEPVVSEGPLAYRRAGFLDMPVHEMEWVSELTKQTVKLF
jgi:hypothetical protein